jgi:hypothetical protein
LILDDNRFKGIHLALEAHSNGLEIFMFIHNYNRTVPKFVFLGKIADDARINARRDNPSTCPILVQCPKTANDGQNILCHRLPCQGRLRLDSTAKYHKMTGENFP